MKKNNFYVYFHITADTKEVFYVGKGSGYRAKRIKGRNKLWNNIVQKHGYEIEYPHNNISEEEAFELEIFYIKTFGRRDINLGTLANLTDGGEGASGHILSQEHKNKISEKLKGRIFSEEHIKRNIDSKKGKPRSIETCEKLRLYRKGKKSSDETKIKISKAGIGRKHSEETKKKISISNIKSKENQLKSVQQISKTGDIINIFKSLSEAKFITGVDDASISRCCKKKQITAGGYIWRYEGDIQIKPIKRKGDKPVIQYTLSESYVNEFQSSVEASNKTGVYYNGIYQCCKGNYKNSGGFIWRFKEN